MRALLDVNLLLALFDPAHVHHEAAHDWFGASRRGGWATCALTENALVRILSNPSYPGRGTTVQDAASRLGEFCQSEHHVFWPDSVSLLDGDVFRLKHVQGHRRLTDTYLLGLAVNRGGRLATCDRTISLRSVAGAAKANLAVITDRAVP